MDFSCYGQLEVECQAGLHNYHGVQSGLSFLAGGTPVTSTSTVSLQSAFSHHIVILAPLVLSRVNLLFILLILSRSHWSYLA